MTDTQEPKRAWTAGSLAYIDGLCKTHHAPTYSEMAEAIMSYEQCNTDLTPEGDGKYEAAWINLKELADRLRRIGGEA